MGISSLQQTYSFGDVTATLNGIDMVGFAEGDDVVMVEPLADRNTVVVGADGSSMHSQAVNFGARITLKVKHGSPLHTRLERQDLAQQNGNRRGIPFTVRDGSTGEGGSCDKALIEKAPGSRFGTTATERTWVLTTGNYVPRLSRQEA